MVGSNLQALILDYGEVLSHPQRVEVVRRLAHGLGVSVDQFTAAYLQHRDAYHINLPASVYWSRVLDSLGVASPAGQSTIQWLTEGDADSWTAYRDEVWELARSFRDAGGVTAMLSNGVPEVMARVRSERELATYFDAVIVSCEVGVAKPDPTIYEIILSRLRVEPHKALFVDDRIENLEGAARLGLRVFRFFGDGAVNQLRTVLQASIDTDPSTKRVSQKPIR